MRLYPSVLLILLLSSTMAGCINPEPTSPISQVSSLPIFLFSYNEDTGNYTIYIHGLDDTQYRWINITIEDLSYSYRNRFSFEIEFNMPSFNITSRVETDTDVFELILSFYITDVENDGTIEKHFTVVDYSLKRIRTMEFTSKDLPWKYTYHIHEDNGT